MEEIKAQNSEPELKTGQTKKSDTVLITIKSQDGVFSNLNAKPELMKMEHIGEYIDKPPSYSQAALNMPPSYQDAIDDFSVIEGMLIGKIDQKKLNGILLLCR